VAVVEAKVTLMAPYQPGIDGKPTEYVVIARPRAAEFKGFLEVPAGGWYVLKLRGKDRHGRVVAEAEVEKVGVGEVFIAAGHSFCGNSQGDAPGKSKDDRVATCANWQDTPTLPLGFRHCDDPLRPANGNRASAWPAVGDELVARLHVPVLIISTGAGGTTVDEWQKSAADPSLKKRGYPQCRTTLQQITPYTGLRAVLWFGNENDLWAGPTPEVFSQNLTQVIAQSRRDGNNPHLPWVIAFDAYFPAVAKKLGLPEKQRRKEDIDRGTEMVLQQIEDTFDGPQTDDLGPKFRRVDGDHFNAAGVQELGVRFARKIVQAFFPSPVRSPQLPGAAP